MRSPRRPPWWSLPLVALAAVVAAAVAAPADRAKPDGVTRQTRTAGPTAPSVWSADAEGPRVQEWANASCFSDARLRRVTAPAAQGRRAYRIDLRDGDRSYGERCEIAMGNPTRAGFPIFREGEVWWIAFQVRFPRGYTAIGRWNTFAQLKQLGELGTPALSLGVREGRLRLLASDTTGFSAGTRELWSGHASEERWLKLLMRVRFDSRPGRGSIELFGDLAGCGVPRPLARRSTHTMKRSSGRAVPSHARVGIYRDEASPGDAHLWVDGFTIGTRREAVERRAFAEPEAGGSTRGARACAD